MNLFWKRLFRVMQTTTGFEKRLRGIHSSETDRNPLPDNMGDLDSLQAFVESDTFKEKKRLYKTTKYKDTKEHKIMRQYEKLLNNSDLRSYYETKNSPLLKRYLDFKSDPNSLELTDLSIVEVSEKIESLKQFEMSKAYKNYMQYHDSLTVREFEELKRKIDDPDFQHQNAFWADPDRWESSYEYRMEQRYLEMKGELTPARSRQRKFSFMKKYSYIRPRFNEEFDWVNLSDSRWSPGFHSANPRLVGNYSFTNELQGNIGGDNIDTLDSILRIHTRQQPIETVAWDIQKGFVERTYGYTSDVMQTAATFKQKYGVFSAKIRCHGSVNHAVWLSGGKKLPHINLFHFDGDQVTVGNAGQHKMDGMAVTGLPSSQFFIYTVEWTPRALIWYINNVEVHRTTDFIPHEPLYLAVNSFIPKNSTPENGLLEIDWIKVYEVRS